MHVRNERGIALVTAVAALVIIGALVSGAFFIGMQEQRVGRNTIGLQQALAAAEEGAQLRLANWDPMTTNAIAIGDSLAFGDTVSGGAGWYRGSVFRLDTLMFLVRAEGFSLDSLARQSVGMLARLRPVEFNVQAGLETQGKIELAGNATISGIDTTGGMTGCATPTDSLPGIRIKEATIDSQGNNFDILGEEGNEVEVDDDISDSSLTTFGDAEFEDLVRLATIVLPGNTESTPYRVEPSASGGECTTSDNLNWGEPEGTVPECVNYFPVIYVQGDLYLNQRRAQGTIIVEGNLFVSGLTKLYGPVIVKGVLVAEGGGPNVPHFFGGVIIAAIGLPGDSTRVAGNAKIFYSSCAISRAMAGGSVAWALQERSWINLY